jgi:hypothetical protein
MLFDRSDSFENPVLQQHFRNLEALALDMMESEQVVDLTRKRCGLSQGVLCVLVPGIEHMGRSSSSLVSYILS